MNIIVHPRPLRGSVAAPPSKSVAQRYVAAALISRRRCTLHDVGESKDVGDALHIAGCLGAAITQKEGLTMIDSRGPISVPPHIAMGESGLAARMFLPIIAVYLNGATVRLTAEGSLGGRPMDFFGQVLPQLGISVHMHSGHFPITLSGQFTPKDIVVDGGLSSQYASGLLMAYTAVKCFNRNITIKNPVSTQYLILTQECVSRFGLGQIGCHATGCGARFVPVAKDMGPAARAASEIGETDSAIFHIDAPCPKQSEPFYGIQGDWSNASFWLLAAALGHPVTVTNLQADSQQGDKDFLDVLASCGLPLTWQGDALSLGMVEELSAFSYDATHTPDLFPPLVVLALFCSGVSTIAGVHRLRHKESDRADTLCSEFRKLGANMRIEQDNLIIVGRVTLRGGTVQAHADHRIAMALAIAALQADSPITILGAECVAKSYPNFFEELKRLQGHE